MSYRTRRPKPLTIRQYEALLAINDLMESMPNWSPTINEIAARLDIPRSTAIGRVETLLNKGLIRRPYKHAARLEITDDGHRALRHADREGTT